MTIEKAYRMREELGKYRMREELGKYQQVYRSSYFGTVHTNGVEIYKTVAYCYMDLNVSAVAQAKAGIKYIVEARSFPKTNPTYIQWLVNDSQWAPCFETKDAKDIIANGFILNTNLPAPFTVQAAILLRDSYENLGFAHGTFYWMDQDVDRRLVPLLCTATEKSGSVPFLTQHFGRNHSAFHFEYVTEASVQNLLNNNPIGIIGKPPMREYSSYLGIYEVWGGKGTPLVLANSHGAKSLAISQPEIIRHLKELASGKTTAVQGR